MFFEINDERHEIVQVDARDNLGNTPLHSAVNSCVNEKAFEFLLRRGANPNTTNTEGSTPLHIICKASSNVDLVKMLFELTNAKYKPVQVNAQDKLGNTPLHLNLDCGCKDTTELLLRNGADPNVANADGMISLHIICKQNYYNDWETILFEFTNDKYKPLQVDAQDNLGNTPLHYTVAKSCAEQTIRVLLKNGANTNLANADGLTPLHIICQKPQRYNDDKNDLEMFFMISKEYRQKLQVNSQDKLGNTALHLALGLVCGYKNLIKSLLQNGLVWVDAQDKRGQTPLHYALAQGCKTDTVQVLLKNGANPNQVDVEGSTPLHILCNRGGFYGDNDDELSQLLLMIKDSTHQPLQVDAKDKYGRTPLFLALINDQIKVAESLMRNGADLSAANAKGLNILTIICMRDQEDLLEELFEICDDVQQTVQVDTPDKLGRTPIQWAVANIMPYTIDILLDHGADLSNFVFPTESYFAVGLEPMYNMFDFKVSLASEAVAVVERLKKRGYELDPSDVLTIMKFLAKYELFKKSTDVEKFCYDDEKCAREAKEDIFCCLRRHDLTMKPCGHLCSMICSLDPATCVLSSHLEGTARQLFAYLYFYIKTRILVQAYYPAPTTQQLQARTFICHERRTEWQEYIRACMLKAGVPFRGDMVEPVPPEVDDEYASDYKPQNENPIPPEHLGEDTVDNDGDDSSSDGSAHASDDENALDSDDDPAPGDEGSENEETPRVGRDRRLHGGLGRLGHSQSSGNFGGSVQETVQYSGGSGNYGGSVQEVEYGSLNNGGSLQQTELQGGSLNNGGSLQQTEFQGGSLNNGGSLQQTKFQGGSLNNGGSLQQTEFQGGSGGDQSFFETIQSGSGSNGNSVQEVEYQSGNNVGSLQGGEYESGNNGGQIQQVEYSYGNTGGTLEGVPNQVPNELNGVGQNQVSNGGTIQTVESGGSQTQGYHQKIHGYVNVNQPNHGVTDISTITDNNQNILSSQHQSLREHAAQRKEVLREKIQQGREALQGKLQQHRQGGLGSLGGTLGSLGTQGSMGTQKSTLGLNVGGNGGNIQIGGGTSGSQSTQQLTIGAPEETFKLAVVESTRTSDVSIDSVTQDLQIPKFS
ncbi:unnamed protein product [Trichogramma brassicae]|uniref:Uncharacterized protein n=1 Tax=Trichogramma brassicae TaxID=86971 RepID=A0A6H5IG88_9HYME|nr:unnamed protein product [Trichogramma brassicae]